LGWIGLFGLLGLLRGRGNANREMTSLRGTTSGDTGTERIRRVG